MIYVYNRMNEKNILIEKLKKKILTQIKNSGEKLYSLFSKK